MPTCPICAKPLETVRQREGLIYPCTNCAGRAMTIPQVRHVLGDRIATRLLRLIKCSLRASERGCPFCRRPMLVVTAQSPLLELEACRLCNAVWLDNPTYESLPQITVETTHSIPMQTTEIIALNRLQELKKREKEERTQAKKRKKPHRTLEGEETH